MYVGFYFGCIECVEIWMVDVDCLCFCVLFCVVFVYLDLVVVVF